MSRLLLFLLFSTGVIGTRAQFTATNNFKCKTYTTQNGLVHNFTIKCQMDSKGFLWIATQNGLSRFDGYQFVNFQNNVKDSSSLPFNELVDMAIDADDRVWLADGKRLCYYNPRQQVFFKMNQAAASLCYDSMHNKLWFSNSDGLFSVNAKTLAVEPSALQTKFPNKPAYTFIDSKQRIWISIERKGYYLYNTTTATFTYYNYEYWPRHVFEDNEHKIWINTWESGLQQFDEGKGSNDHSTYRLSLGMSTDLIYQDATQSLPLTGPDILWVATHTEGIAFFDKRQQRFTGNIQYDGAEKSGIATNFNSSIYTDKNGIVWICTWKGLTKVNRQEQQFQSAELKYLASHDYNLLTSIIDDPYNNNIVWVGSEGCGICSYDKTKQQPVQWYFRNTLGADIEANYLWRWIGSGIKDNKNNIWYSTYAGLVKVAKGQVSKVPISYQGAPAFVRKIKTDEDGSLWICTAYGLVHFDPVTHAYQFKRMGTDPTDYESLYDIADINNNELCCAYAGIGAYSFNKKTGSYKKIPIPAAFTSQPQQLDINCLAKAGNSIYMGTTIGLLRYDITSGNINALGREHDIFKIQPNALRADAQQHIWIYTLHGLFMYNAENNQFKKFTTADGIYDNSSDPVQMFTYQNNMYIGYRMAYTRFDPAQVATNSTMAIPYITAVSINNRPIKMAPVSLANDRLTLAYQENNVLLNFTAIDYTNTDKISFACMLEGFDTGWVYMGTTRKINYANLKGGHYVFKLKACNSSGLWNEKYAVFTFDIKPPIWQYWWFWPLLALLFVALVVMLARKRIEHIRRKETEKTAVNKTMAELETKMLRSQMNPHFIFNSLNSVQKYIWENKEEDAAEYLAKFAKLIRAILENSRHEFISLQEEIDSIKLYVELEHRRSNCNFDYSIKIDPQIDIANTLTPPLLLQPFIENAIWHGLNKKKEKGNLQISISKNNNTLIGVVDDDGVGRTTTATPAPGKKQSLGIAITQQRIEKLMGNMGQQASVTIEDKIANGLPNGTRVTVTLPFKTSSHA